MFACRALPLLQQLHNSISQIELQRHLPAEHVPPADHPPNYYPAHFLTFLKDLERQFRVVVSQDMQFWGRIHQKVTQAGKSAEVGTQLMQLGIIQNFIDQAVARQQLSQLQFSLTRSQIASLQPHLSKFPALQKQAEARIALSREIETIDAHLCRLEHKFEIEGGQQEKTLHCCKQRLKNMIKVISQSQVHNSAERKVVPLAEYVKQHRQAENVLNLIYQGNVRILEEAVENISSGEIRRVASKVAKQLRRCNQSIQRIYEQLRQPSRKQSPACQHFLNSVNYLSFSKKLKQCEKLITFAASSPFSLTPLSLTGGPFSLSGSPFSLTGSRQQVQRKLHYPPTGSKQEQKNNEEPLSQSSAGGKTEQTDFQHDIMLLQKEEIIYDLQQQTDLLNQQVASLSLQNQTKNAQISKLLADCRQQELSIKVQLRQKDAQTAAKITELNQNCQKWQQKNSQQQTSVRRLQQKNNQLETAVLKSAGYMQKWRRALELQQRAEAESKGLHLEYARQSQENYQLIAQLNNQLVLSRQLVEQKQQQIRQKQRQVQQAQLQLRQMAVHISCLTAQLKTSAEKADIASNLQNKASNLQNKALNLQSNTLTLSLTPNRTSNIEYSALQSCPEKRNSSELAFVQGLSEQSIDVQEGDEDKPSKLSHKHCLSFAGQNGPQFESWAISKKEQQSSHSIQSLQVQKAIASKDRAIKRYQAFINRYRSESKKYQKQILQLQAKTRKLQLQNLRLSQIVDQHNTHQQLLTIQQQPGELHLDISQELQGSNLEKLAEKEVQLRAKEQSINFKIEGIINTVLQLNAFKTEAKQSTQTSIAYQELEDLEESANPEAAQL